MCVSLISAMTNDFLINCYWNVFIQKNAKISEHTKYFGIEMMNLSPEVKIFLATVCVFLVIDDEE